MNRSFSKIRHIQEANRKLESRILSEQMKRNSLRNDLASGDILNVSGKDGSESKINVLRVLPYNEEGFVGRHMNNPQKVFKFGTGDNQLKYTDTEIGGHEFTIKSVQQGEKGTPLPVDKDGKF